LSAPSIAPAAKSLYICDGHIGLANQKTDLLGIFNAIRPSQYPHTQKHFVIFAQLLAGLGLVPFYFDIRYAPDGSLVHTTSVQQLFFPNRNTLIQMAYTMQDCVFLQAGIYSVELFCSGPWVADTTLKLL